MGTPATTSNILTIRNLTIRNGIRKSPTEKDFSSKFETEIPNSEFRTPKPKVSENVSTGGGDETSINDSMYLTADDDDSCFDHSTTDVTVVADVITAVTVAESEEEVEASIYSMSRHSFHEDADNLADNLVDSIAGNFAEAVTTPATLSATVDENLVDKIDENKVDTEEKTEFVVVVDNTDATNNKNLNDVDDLKVVVDEITSTAERPKRRHKLSTGSSTVSSKEERGGFGLTLAVPHLAGFIESWNPFGSGRFFDTPPESAENERFGFTLKPEVRIGALNEASSQALMQLFDQV